jgi:hypothetical protein
MKRVFRWTFRLFLVLLALFVAGILLLDTFVREIAEHQIRKETGLETKIGRMHVGLLDPGVTIENLVIYNSAEFGGAPFIEMPELHVEYDRDALWARKLHCRLVRFNLAEVNVVEDKSGRRNFDTLQPNGPRNGAAPKSGGGKNKSSVDLRFTGIDTLNLTLGKATYLKMQDPGKVEELNMNVNHQVFKNIRTQQDLTAALMLALLRSGVNLMPGGAGSPNWLQLLAPQKK